MLAFLLARAGVEVVVLEKHADFLRDFRGDTVHPSTLEVMHELGLLEEFLKLPHQEVRQLGGQIGEDFLQLADFSHLPTKCKFIALVPQWDFLDFLADHARQYPTFKLIMQAEVVDVITEGGRVAGVEARAPDEDLEVRADLMIGAVGYITNRKHLSAPLSAKTELALYIQQNAPVPNLGEPTSRPDWGFGIWHFRL